MTVLSHPLHHRPARPTRNAILIIVTALSVAAVLALVLTAISDDGTSGTGSTTVQGSGVSATETREVATFTGVELAGANTVTIQVGSPQSVAVTADDNLLDRVTTKVTAGDLVIGSQGSYTTSAPTSVAVSVPTLDGLILSGSGTVTVEDVTGPEFTADMSGTGTLVASGKVDRLTVTLSGTGEVALQSLTARDVTARLAGTGDLHVNATGSLHADLSGTGSIRYTGSPATMTESVTGTGSVTAE